MEGRGSNESRKFQGVTELGVQAMTTMIRTSKEEPQRGKEAPQRKDSPCAERLF